MQTTELERTGMAVVVVAKNGFEQLMVNVRIQESKQLTDVIVKNEPEGCDQDYQVNQTKSIDQPFMFQFPSHCQNDHLLMKTFLLYKYIPNHAL